MAIRADSFARDLADAECIDDELKQLDHGADDADNQPPVFMRMLASQCNRAFAIDEAGNVRGGFAC
jgi:hypothetical protein